MRLEDCIRPFVIARKAWLFADTPAGAETSANLYYLRQLSTVLPQATAGQHVDALPLWNIDRGSVSSMDPPATKASEQTDPSARAPPQGPG